MAAATQPICDFGWQAKPFALQGVDDKLWTLDDVRGERGTLVIFICNHCPYVRSVIDRIVETAAHLEGHGIGSVAINANDPLQYPADDFAHMQDFAREHDFGFPYLIDETQEVAHAYEAVCTPDFFGFDADLGLQYRGRLDASKTTLLPDAEPELLNAMIRVAETGEGPREQTPSMGCSIKWRNAA
jgi:peroxiredoxin